MKIRKIISLSIAAILTVSLLFSTSAQAISKPVAQSQSQSAKITREKAITLAKSILDGAASFEVTNIFLNQNWGLRKYVWSIDLNYLKSLPTRTVNVNIDGDTGEVISFSEWENSNAQQIYIAKYTRSEASKIAETFLKNKLYKKLDGYELMKEDPSYYGYKLNGVHEQIIFNFNYIRKINGVLLTDDSINISINGTNGKVMSYYYNTIPIDIKKLPKKDKILSEDQAINMYKTNSGLSLQYITIYEQQPYGESKQYVILAYVPSNSMNIMNALTGNNILYDGTEIDYSTTPYKQMALNPKPLVPGFTIKSKTISEVQAKDKAEKLKNLAEKKLGVKFTQNNDNYYKVSNQSDGFWSYNWNNSNNSEFSNFDIQINKKTGHVTSMNIGRSNVAREKLLSNTKKPVFIKEKYTWKAAKAKALEAIKLFVPEQYGFYADNTLVQPSWNDTLNKTMTNYDFNFVRVANGIRFRDNNINVSIDRETGKVRNMYFNWSDMELPANTGLIDYKKASEIYYNDLKPKLAYYYVRSYDKVLGKETVASVPKLVYTFANSGYSYSGDLSVNAKTGKLITWGGIEAITNKVLDVSALKEHWAKRSIELLLSQGILRLKDLSYDQEITRADAVKMLALSKGLMYTDGVMPTLQTFKDVTKDSEYYIFIEGAVRNGIVKPGSEKFEGSTKITKNEFVALLVNMMGYGNIAQHNEIFVSDGLVNVPVENRGNVAICKALNVLPVEEGAPFDGNSTVTLAEATAALYKALSYIR